MQKRKGFTLIELLVVIAIIALLATLAVVAFNGAQVKARDSKRVADANAMVTAFASAYQDGSGAYVICQKGCGAALTGITQVSNVDICNVACGGGAGSIVTGNYTNLANLHDPTPGLTVCTAIPMAAGSHCDYSINAAATLNNFTVEFTTESTSIQGLGAGTVHTAAQTGIVN